MLEATVAAMVGLGARRPSIAAVIGPCIRQPSYEVGPDVRDAVLAHDASRAGGDASHAGWFIAGSRPGRWQFDLAGYCRSECRTVTA